MNVLWKKIGYFRKYDLYSFSGIAFIPSYGRLIPTERVFLSVWRKSYVIDLLKIIFIGILYKL